METFIFKVMVTVLTLTVQPNCPAEDGLYCLNHQVKEIPVFTTEVSKDAHARLEAYQALVESDTLVEHVRSAQYFISARLDSVAKKAP